MIRIGPVKVKVQIFCGDDPAIGPGKADLLEAIDREGSISAAGRALGMSYRRTWMLVDTLNRSWSGRVVETIPGGSREKGARLTPFGRTLLANYRELESQLEKAATGAALDDILAALRPTPLPAQDNAAGTSKRPASKNSRKAE